MKKIGKIIAVVAVLFASFGMVSNTYAAYLSDEEYNKVCTSDLDEVQKEAAGCNTEDRTVIKNVLAGINTVIAAIGILAVLMIVVAGQRFVSAAGDSQKVEQAKNMIIYSVVAVVVSALAFSVVSFVSSQIKNDANMGSNSSLNGGSNSGNTTE